MEGHGGSDVFLTAAHCLVGLDPAPVPGLEVLVTFDEVIEPTSTFYTGTIHTHPDFGTHGMADLFDVAVIVLDNAPDVGFGELPEAGLLDAMQKSSDLRAETFTAVGYGTVRETRQGAFDSILVNARRNKADQQALSLTKAWLTLSMNEATGNGGTCYGDSGGPHFIKGTNTVVSLTVTGDTVCKATDKTYRLDTAGARDFLAQFMPLP
jgi:secreted trypsin-like serine protease